MEGITIAKAGACGIGGAGVVGATGYGAYTLMQPSNIREQLEWNGKTLLDLEGDTSKSDWTTLGGKYPVNNDKKLKDVNSLTGEDNPTKGTDLKTKCKSAVEAPLTTPAADAEQLEAAGDWCTKQSKHLSSK